MLHVADGTERTAQVEVNVASCGGRSKGDAKVEGERRRWKGAVEGMIGIKAQGEQWILMRPPGGMYTFLVRLPALPLVPRVRGGGGGEGGEREESREGKGNESERERWRGDRTLKKNNNLSFTNVLTNLYLNLQIIDKRQVDADYIGISNAKIYAFIF